MVIWDQTTKIQSFSVNNTFLILQNLFEQESFIVSHRYLDGIMFS